MRKARAKVTQFAHISPLPEDYFDYEVLFAVPPSGDIILGGAPTALGAQERQRLVDAFDRLSPAIGVLTARWFALIFRAFRGPQAQVDQLRIPSQTPRHT